MANIKKEIIYPELSYKIIGIAFKVFNEIGFGMSEKHYQKIFAYELGTEKIQYEREKCIKLKYQGQQIGNYFLDFIVERKIIVELKVRPRFGYVHIKQAMTYLKESDLKLAIIIYFTREGIKYKRIVNLR